MSGLGDWSRRDVLKLGAAAGAVAAAGGLLDACEAPTVTLPAHPTLHDIEHVVIILQENRSFDHYYGTRKGSLGFGDPNPALTGAGGRAVWYQPSTAHPDGYLLPYRAQDPTHTPCLPDIDHSWGGQHAAWNGGRNDGFAQQMGVGSMGYLTRAELPFYSHLADLFCVADHYHCSVMGPTTPNRLYSMTGTIDPAGTGGGPVTGNLTGPFRWDTYPERLSKAGVSWRVYHEVDDYDDNVLKWFASFQGLPGLHPYVRDALAARTPTDFADDVRAKRLPQVSWVVAPPVFSEHPPFPAAAGESYVSQFLFPLMADAATWAKTVVILTCDENGGFFDHVVPPTPPPGTPGEYVGGTPIGLGFRVPTLVMSPYSRHVRVCSEVFDHTSTLRFLEARFGVEVPNLSAWRRATCGDLTAALDFSKGDLTLPGMYDPRSHGDEMLYECWRLPVAQPPAHQGMPTVA